MTDPYRTIRFSTLTNPAKPDVCLMEQRSSLILLKNALLIGLDLLQNLIHVLIRFRQYQNAVSAGIEGMFLQIGVIPQDQPSFRFLCREDPAEKIAVYQNVRHIFGANDSPTCANYALRRNAADNETTFPEATRSVKDNCYMDDYLESSLTVEQIIWKARDLMKMLAKGRFTLTKFVSKVSGFVVNSQSNRKSNQW